MRYLLDTNICIYIIKQKPQKVLDKFQTLNPEDVGIPSITVAELEYGAYKSQRREQNQAALKLFLSPLAIVPFDESAARACGEIRGQLEQQGTVIGSMDMLIAAQAQSLRLALVTNNIREFSRVPNLALENWA